MGIIIVILSKIVSGICKLKPKNLKKKLLKTKNLKNLFFVKNRFLPALEQTQFLFQRISFAVFHDGILSSEHRD